MIGIYKFINKFDRKTYIGKSINIEDRYKKHIKLIQNGATSHFYNAVRKYGIENFDFDILIECPKENLNYWERFYVNFYCSNNPKYGYNMTPGGDGTGRKQSQEEKDKRWFSALNKHWWPCTAIQAWRPAQLCFQG